MKARIFIVLSAVVLTLTSVAFASYPNGIAVPNGCWEGRVTTITPGGYDYDAVVCVHHNTPLPHSGYTEYVYGPYGGPELDCEGDLDWDEDDGTTAIFDETAVSGGCIDGVVHLYYDPRSEKVWYEWYFTTGGLDAEGWLDPQ